MHSNQKIFNLSPGGGRKTSKYSYGCLLAHPGFLFNHLKANKHERERKRPFS